MDTESLLRGALPIEGGLSNRTYRLPNGRILRLKEESDPAFYKPGQEAESLKETEGAGLSPKVYEFAENGDLLMEEAPGAHPFRLAKDKGRLPEIASLIRNLHGLARQNHDFDAKRRLLFYSGGKLSETSFSLLDGYEKATHPLPLVFSHNDFVPGNLLMGETRIWLIDFEFAGANHPYFDIASFLSEGEPGLRLLKDPFLELVLGRSPSQRERDLLTLTIAFEDLLWSSWAKWRHGVTHKEEFLLIAREKERFLQQEEEDWRLALKRLG